MHATTIINARAKTMDAAGGTATSIRIGSGRILELDVEPAPGDTVLDARGRTIIPGFNDVHAHSVWFGQTLREIDLGSARRRADVLEALQGTGGDEWVVASGFNPSLLEDGPLSIAELDRATNGKPLLIKHNSGHAYTVNTEALRRAGIDPAHPPRIEGGEVVVDADGHATGLLDENAMRPINDVLQPESESDITDALDRAGKRYLAEGVTSVTDAGVAGGWIGHSPQEFGFYQRARDTGKLHVRTQAMITLDALHSLDGHADDPAVHGLDAGIRTGLGDELLQIGPVKIFTDGSLLGKTAALTQDYVCCHHAGYFQGDTDTMRARALGAAAGGWSLALHAIGDKAVDFALDVIGEAVAEHGQRAVPHRIEHGGVVRDDQLARMAQLGIVLVPQPRFIAEFGDSMAQVLGAERAALSYPGKRLLDHGVVLPGSSDRPVATGTPLRVVQSFVERTTASGAEYGPADRISVDEALYAYTAGSAAATGWAGKKGQIAPGQLADLVLLGADPAEVESHEISDIPIDATVLGGEIVHGDF